MFTMQPHAACRLFAVLLPVLATVGCQTGPAVYTNVDPDADFAAYRTFAFGDPLGTDRGDGTRTLLSKFLVRETTNQLQQRGYVKADDASAADLRVNFFLHTEDRRYTYSTPAPYPYYSSNYGYRRYGAWNSYRTVTRQYTEGTLTIDLIDAALNQLVWEGTAVGEVQRVTDQNLEAEAAAVVRAIFGKFPVAAGAAVAKAPSPLP